MNRIEFTKKAKQMLIGMPPHVASHTTANMLRDATDELSRECEWIKDIDGSDIYDTECGNSWVFTDGGIADNLVVYCPYCGGTVKEND